MATLTETEIIALIKDALVIDVSTDVPVDATTLRRAINDAYAMVWEISGGARKKVASATAWTSAQTATGVVQGLLTDINRIESLFASTTAGSVGETAGDRELERAELSYLQYLRQSYGVGSVDYSVPKLYAVTRIQTVTPADVGKHQLDYWPGSTGFYFPVHYLPQFALLSDAVTTPDVNDLESRDIGWIAAAKLAPGVGRAELAPGILMNVSDLTAKALDRKLTALLSGSQDR